MAGLCLTSPACLEPGSCSMLPRVLLSQAPQAAVKSYTSSAVVDGKATEGKVSALAALLSSSS